MTYAHGSAVVSGDVVQIGALVGIATGSYDANEEGEYSLMGVYDLPKDSAFAPAIGTAVEWDDTAKEVVGDTFGDFEVGYAFEAGVNGETSMKVLLPLGGY